MVTDHIVCATAEHPGEGVAGSRLFYACAGLLHFRTQVGSSDLNLRERDELILFYVLFGKSKARPEQVIFKMALDRDLADRR
jgi:hypothetical protein